MKKMLRVTSTCLLLALCISMVMTAHATEQEPIRLKTMGSLFFGGTVTSGSDGDTFHGDHGYAQYYVPADSRQ